MSFMGFHPIEAWCARNIVDRLQQHPGHEGTGRCQAVVNEAAALGELHKADLPFLDVRLARGNRGSEIARRLNNRGKFGVGVKIAW
jgi:hypothetical protein